MRAALSHARFTFVITLVLSASIPLQGQQPTFLIPVELKGQTLRGSIAIAQHENEGMIGINGKGTEDGYKVEIVTPGFPAATAGVLPGDIVTSMDETPTNGLDSAGIAKLTSHKHDGETINLTIIRQGETKIVPVRVASKKRLFANDAQWQAESKLPPTVGQFIFGGSAVIQTTLVVHPARTGHGS